MPSSYLQGISRASMRSAWGRPITVPGHLCPFCGAVMEEGYGVSLCSSLLTTVASDPSAAGARPGLPSCWCCGPTKGCPELPLQATGHSCGGLGLSWSALLLRARFKCKQKQFLEEKSTNVLERVPVMQHIGLLREPYEARQGKDGFRLLTYPQHNPIG